MTDRILNQPGRHYGKTFSSQVDALNYERNSGIPMLDTSILKPGDVLKATFNDGKGQLVFEIDDVTIRYAGINVGSPQVVQHGKLSGNVHPEFVGKEFSLVGNSHGQVKDFRYLIPGREFNFISSDHEVIFKTPSVNEFVIEQPIEDDQNTGQSEVELEEVRKIHSERLEKMKGLMKQFKFSGDMGNFEKASVMGQSYEDGRYVATYRNGMALGNVISVLDKLTNEWIQIGYYNLYNEDVLKFTRVDLSKINTEELFSNNDVGVTYKIFPTGASITTLNTSMNGLNIINYHPGRKELDELGINDYGSEYRSRGRKPPFDVVLFSNGRVSIDVSSFFIPIDESHPNALKKIHNALGVDFTSNGASFSFNGHNIADFDPNTKLDQILSNTTKSHSIT